MPLDCIPIETFGFVVANFGSRNQARLRSVRQSTHYAFAVAVLNEQFIDLAGAMDNVSTP